MPRIYSAALMTVLGLTLAACATSRPPKLAVCDANPKHRRDANPFGSVLPGAPFHTPATGNALLAPTPAPAPTAAPTPSTTLPPESPPKTSASAAPPRFASC